MPDFSKHEHGTFSWIELMTTDAKAAKSFYTGLFGWTFEDMPAGPGMVYSMASLGGKHVGAAFEMGPEMKGIPAHWASYVTVDKLEDAVAKVTAAGGNIVKAPFDVLDVGRMAVVADPTGATLSLWEARKHIGAQVKNEVGALCWTELFTNNVDAAGKFYVNALGWKPKAIDMGPMGTYTLFKIAEDDQSSVGGMMALPPDMKGVPPHWLPYVQVTDCDATAKKAVELGAKLHVPPTDIPNIGRFAILADPTGAVLGLYKHMH